MGLGRQGPAPDGLPEAQVEGLVRCSGYEVDVSLHRSVLNRGNEASHVLRAIRDALIAAEKPVILVIILGHHRADGISRIAPFQGAQGFIDVFLVSFSGIDGRPTRTPSENFGIRGVSEKCVRRVSNHGKIHASFLDVPCTGILLAWDQGVRIDLPPVVHVAEEVEMGEGIRPEKTSKVRGGGIFEIIPIQGIEEEGNECLSERCIDGRSRNGNEIPRGCNHRIGLGIQLGGR